MPIWDIVDKKDAENIRKMTLGNSLVFALWRMQRLGLDAPGTWYVCLRYHQTSRSHHTLFDCWLYEIEHIEDAMPLARNALKAWLLQMIDKL